MDLKKTCRILISGIFLSGIGSIILHGQPERKYIRQGNGDYRDNKFAEAELNYRKALDKNPISTDARFNLGGALYRQEKMDEAGKSYAETAANARDDSKKSDAFYNYGNTLLKSQKFEESINAFKNSLKINPENMEAKYNLAYAQDQLRQQNEEKNKDNKQEEPSEFAKRLKAEADRLIAAGKFIEAFKLMQDGLKKDQTVSYYRDFIEKTGKVAEIDLKIK
jgi:tetratricopeptide (TPR) repeat protein